MPKEGRLDVRDLNVLKDALSGMGSAPKAYGFVVTLSEVGPHVGDCERMGHPVGIQCFQG